MAFQEQKPRIKLNYLHLEIFYVGTRSVSKNNYTDCRDFLLIKEVDIAFTFRSPQF
jgi:hypothetical protein